MSILAVFQLITIVSSLVILFIVVKRFWNSGIGRSYSALVLIMLMWSIADVLLTLSPNEKVAGFWEGVGEVSSVFLAPILVQFIFVLTNSNSKFHKILIRILFLLSTGFLIASFDKNLFPHEMVRNSLRFQPIASTGYIALTVYDAIVTISSLLFAAVTSKRMSGLKKRQIQLFLIAFSIPIVGGFVSEIVFPILNLVTIPLTTPLMSATGIVIVYAIGKYQFLSITPSIAYETVFNTVSDALIVINATESIELINDAAKTILGYEKAELVGKPLSLVLKGSGTADVNSDHILHEHLKNTEMIFLPKDPSKQIPVQINSSPIVVEGDPQGAVLAIRDISRMKELIVNLEQRSKELDKSKTDLEVQLHEVKRMNELMLGREKKMIELNKQVESLKSGSAQTEVGAPAV